MEIKKPGKELEKYYWFYLHSYVHVSIKKNNAILYNTLTGKLLEYNENDSLVLKIIKRINSKKNLYVIRLDQKTKDKIVKFIHEIKKYFIGDLLDTCYCPGKPIQFKPMPFLQKNTELILNFHKKFKMNLLNHDTLKEYLKSIYLYINNQCKQNCTMCKNEDKQILICYKSDEKCELPIENIKVLLNETQGISLKALNVLGGNIFEYSNFIQLVDMLNQKKMLEINYFVHYCNIPKEIKYLEILNNSHSIINIFINFPIIESDFRSVLAVGKEGHLNLKYKFIVENERDVQAVEKLIDHNKIEKFDLIPFFNGKNLEFFRENVFVDKNTILKSRPSMKDIFARNLLNTFNIKKIVIHSDKKIYANVNNPPIGELGEKNIYSIITQEFKDGKSWAKIRKNEIPCRDCVFNSLCPPITNYEYIFGYYNLCKIWSKNCVATES